MVKYRVSVEVELTINTESRVEATETAAEIVKSFGLDFVQISDVYRVNELEAQTYD